MKIININDHKFICFKNHKATIIFSTAERELNFQKDSDEGKKNLKNLKKLFDLKNVIYLNQIHSDNIFIYDKDIRDNKIYDGDALITNKNNTAVGVFAADCVPVILYDSSKNVIGAIHSGWRGTYSLIVKKAIKLMKKNYNTCSEDVHVYIGPHIKSCCYEVSEELIDKFNDLDIYSNLRFENNKLDLQKCIEQQIVSENVPKKNIYTTDLCTYCSKEHKLHSYRRDKEASGRMFAFVYLDEQEL